MSKTSQQKQQQQFKQSQKEVQLEQQFYVHQDLENVLGILAETSLAFKLLENHKDQSYLPIAYNRLVLQTNLSNAIQYDQYLTYETKSDLLKSLHDEKKKASDHFNQIVFEQKLIDTSNPKIKEICDHYLKNNLAGKNIMQQLVPEKVTTKATFNSETLSKVIGGIQSVDQQIQEIRNGKYEPPSLENLIEKIKERQKNCEEKLTKNFGIPINKKQNSPKMPEMSQQKLQKIGNGDQDLEPEEFEDLDQKEKEIEKIEKKIKGSNGGDIKVDSQIEIEHQDKQQVNDKDQINQFETGQQQLLQKEKNSKNSHSKKSTKKNE